MKIGPLMQGVGVEFEEKICVRLKLGHTLDAIRDLGCRRS